MLRYKLLTFEASGSLLFIARNTNVFPDFERGWLEYKHRTLDVFWASVCCSQHHRFYTLLPALSSPSNQFEICQAQMIYLTFIDRVLGAVTDVRIGEQT